MAMNTDIAIKALKAAANAARTKPSTIAATACWETPDWEDPAIAALRAYDPEIDTEPLHELRDREHGARDREAADVLLDQLRQAARHLQLALEAGVLLGEARRIDRPDPYQCQMDDGHGRDVAEAWERLIAYCKPLGKYPSREDEREFGDARCALRAFHEGMRRAAKKEPKWH